jgi:hypothetical protein
MKKLSICTTIFFMLLICFYSNNLQAQFLKKIINTVKNTAQNRANDQAAQSTNSTIDKTVSGSTSNTNNSSMQAGDNASTNKVLGAFAQAAQQNPNDTSSADLTMKALGNLIGGGGVSAADSAAAIKSFMTAKGGSGYYYESVTTVTTKNGSSKDTSKIYMASSGEGRAEMGMHIPGAIDVNFINLGHAANPRYSVMIYPGSKTYALNLIDTSLINSNIETYEVTKMGNETVNGYNCTHAKLKSTTGEGMFKSSSTMDIWTSEDVPGYALMRKIMLDQNVKPQMMQALEQNNCGGYIVKMMSSAKEAMVEMELIKALNKSFPASLFEIPEGYSESQENMIYYMGSAKK